MPKPTDCGTSTPAPKYNPPPPKLHEDTVKWLTEFAKRLKKGNGR